eukprot:455584-Pleurochrysis_carterae.AAC.1
MSSESPSKPLNTAKPPKSASAATPCASAKLDVEDGSEATQPPPARGCRDAKGVWPIVSLITNVVFLTAAITAGMMHALSSDHGGHLPSRVLALVTTGVAYAIAVCTAAFIGFLLTPL